ncbi:MAG TPA: NAD(+) synthase, partial [Caulobacteraceae bacterium]|nr:NAD(+) synthase [Caulobacteraceae bacterium]
MSARPFRCLYRHDFARVAAAVPSVEVGDPAFNLAATLRLAEQADRERAVLAAFPELGLSAYAIDDLLFQDALLDAVEDAIAQLAEASQGLNPALV